MLLSAEKNLGVSSTSASNAFSTLAIVYQNPLADELDVPSPSCTPAPKRGKSVSSSMTVNTTQRASEDGTEHADSGDSGIAGAAIHHAQRVVKERQSEEIDLLKAKVESFAPFQELSKLQEEVVMLRRSLASATNTSDRNAEDKSELKTVMNNEAAAITTNHEEILQANKQNKHLKDLLAKATRVPTLVPGEDSNPSCSA